MTLRALAVVNGEFIAVCGGLVYSGGMGLKHKDPFGVKAVQNVEGMNTRKLLLTGLAVLSISLGAMAQQRNDKPDNRPENRQPEHFVKEVPKGGREVVYKDVHYHYSEGRYYRPQKEGFEIVQPPVGMEVDRLPPGYAVKKHKGGTYYYKNDVCYKKGPKKNTYVIVKRPW